MLNTLHHRGPDDADVVIIDNQYAKIGLGHARLAIIDTSSAGHQPMRYKNLTIVFNGEIYNYQEIRKELEVLGDVFYTNSDTEVILHAFSHWGKEAVSRFVGMFAFVIFDDSTNQVTVFRDRLGVKPFYYTFWDNCLLFGSELKSLLAHPRFEKEIDTLALSKFFDLGYIPAPYTIYQNTYKLNPGYMISLDLVNKQFHKEQYWDVHDYMQKPKLAIPYQEAKETTQELLASACEYRMVADVPVGVFLSGGIDSTMVAAMLQSNRTQKLKTFTIGFEKGNNEAPFAKKTAEFLGTDHTEYICTEKEAQDIIPQLPFIYDEPFADQSAIPTTLVSRIAREQVTVALSADGGDELFAGYKRYAEFEKRTQALASVPYFLKKLGKPILGLVEQTLPESKVHIAHRLQGIKKSVHRNPKAEAHRLYNSIHSLPDAIATKGLPFYHNPNSFILKEESEFYSNIELAMATDFIYYLPDDILTKVDRATMSVGLEGREPLLDHRLIEYVSQLPLAYKFDGHIQKKILKDILYGYVPKDMMNRPKRGFSVPVFHWLANDLAYLVDEYLSYDRLKESDVFNTEYVFSLVEKFKRGEFYYKPFIWRLLVFQMWHERWVK